MIAEIPCKGKHFPKLKMYRIIYNTLPIFLFGKELSMKKSKKKVDKIDQETLEQFAKEKNIDKNKIENIANSYQGKSEDELLDELINIGKNLKGKEEVVSKFKNFLNPEQQQKLDSIMNKISEAEIQDKINSKKSKKSSSHHSPSGKKTVKKVKRVKKSN